MNRLPFAYEHSPGIRTGKQSGRVLYIEDNISNIELVSQTLAFQRPDLILEVCTSGSRAMDMAVEHLPDLILLDLNLPGLHGSEVLELLQADDQTRTVPVVIISADAMPLQLEKMLRAGARQYLTKPLDLKELLKVIDGFF